MDVEPSSVDSEDEEPINEPVEKFQEEHPADEPANNTTSWTWTPQMSPPDRWQGHDLQNKVDTKLAAMITKIVNNDFLGFGLRVTDWGPMKQMRTSNKWATWETDANARMVEDFGFGLTPVIQTYQRGRQLDWHITPGLWTPVTGS